MPRQISSPHFLLPTLVTLTLTLLSTAQPSKSPHKIALLHLHDDAPFFADLGALTLSAKRRYAERQSYEVVAHTPETTEGLWKPASCKGGTRRGDACYSPTTDFAIDERAPTFGKIKLARAACVGRDGYWLLWSDADAMPVNHSVPLQSVIDDRYDIGLSADWLMINAGIIVMKCSAWSASFLKRVYEADEFDDARALDQSAFQHFFDTEEAIDKQLYHIPKRLINVYVEEYRPGDFYLHMAGKLYEATTKGALAIAHQFDVLSYADDFEDVEAFFRGQHFLNKYSGICLHAEGVKRDSECAADDERRLKLEESLSSMSHPNRYRHVGMRYYWLDGWEDKYDFAGWDEGRKVFQASEDDDGVAVADGTHDEL